MIITLHSIIITLSSNTNHTQEKEKKIMYDYKEAMKEDIREYLKYDSSINFNDWMSDRAQIEQQLNVDLWTVDSVTGNASGSYTFNRVQASLYVLDNIDLLREAFFDFYTDSETIADKFLSEDWEYFDVTIRCYLLSQVITEVLDDLQDEFEEEEEEG